jgi:hypothetical protein
MILCSKYGNKINAPVMEFTLDEETEIQYLPTTTDKGSGDFAHFNQCAPVGSTAIIGNNGGDLLVYMLFSFGWKKM